MSTSQLIQLCLVSCQSRNSSLLRSLTQQSRNPPEEFDEKPPEEFDTAIENPPDEFDTAIEKPPEQFDTAIEKPPEQFDEKPSEEFDTAIEKPEFMSIHREESTCTSEIPTKVYA